MLNNRDFNIDKNNRDYHFVHNRSALVVGIESADSRISARTFHHIFKRVVTEGKHGVPNLLLRRDEFSPGERVLKERLISWI